MSNDNQKSRWGQLIKILLWFLILITLVSTLREFLTPLFPTASEYNGSFPSNFTENFNEWLSNGLPHRLVTVNEYFNIGWILGLLSQIFFLRLLINIKDTLATSVNTKDLLQNYTNWAISGILVSIVFLTKSINENTAVDIGLASIGFSITILLLLFVGRFIGKSKENNSEE